MKSRNPWLHPCPARPALPPNGAGFVILVSMTEAQFQTRFNKWVRYRYDGPTAAFELKVTKGSSLPFSAVQPHQVSALNLAKHKQLPYKIADVGRLQKPFDCFVLKGVPAYIVVLYNCNDRQKKNTELVFYMIDIDAWLSIQTKIGRKSLPIDVAMEIGIRCAMPTS